MRIYEVLIEYAASSLDRPFSYAYLGDQDIKKMSRVIIDFNNRPVCGVVINTIDNEETIEDYQKRTGYQVKYIQKVLDSEPLINEELSCLVDDVSSYYFCPKISVFLSMLPPSMKPSISSQKKPKISYETMVKTKDDFDYDGLTTKQAELLYRIASNGALKKSECSLSIINSLLKKNKIEIFYDEKNRFKFDEINKVEDLKLNDEQEEVLNEIYNTNDSIYLLEGVTGSGKTEVYLQLAKKIISDGKKVLILVPEISLSYMMVNRFQTRFDNIAVLHSELTPGERYDEYRRIRRGEVDIVIGARSAVFAPLENIGLVVIDEEHSETYKQEDQMPYYNALEVAKMRQKYHGFKLLLGSATPSLDSKSRALRGVYHQLYLKNRVNDLSLPEVELVNMSDFRNIDRESVLISVPLKNAIKERLENKEQTILLVNRRGYSPYVSCRKCGKVMKCPTCEVALTFHYETQKLSCHHCGYEQNMISECPKCGSDKVFKSGFGTEKIVQEVEKLFPSARVLRLDSDVSRKRKGAKEVLTSFENHQADILVGTQIVAKGHDFPKVTLVGVILADIGLAIPSFRASERTFSLITQAVGRAGRNGQGKAFIQTYQKDHFVIKTAASQDYFSFYNQEIVYRKLMQNPPYRYMCLLIVSGRDEDEVIDSIFEVEKYLKSHLNEEDNVSIIGPSELFLKVYNNQHRRKIVLKYKSYDVVKPLLEDLRLFFNKKSNINLIINIDPFEDY